MTKYITVLVGVVLVGVSAFAGTALAARMQSGILVAQITGSTGKEQRVMKIVDGTTTCYVVAEQFPAISCVK